MKFLLTIVYPLVFVAVVAGGKQTIDNKKLRGVDVKPLVDLEKPVFRNLTAYRYVNCGDPNNDILRLTTLAFGPDPLRLPGNLEVEFSGELKTNVYSPLKAVVDLKKKIHVSGFNLWAKIPCENNFGSCTYDDLCAMLSRVSCPSVIVSAHMSCKCPFGQGSFQLPKTLFYVGGTLPSGDYHITVQLSTSSRAVACIELYVTLA